MPEKFVVAAIKKVYRARGAYIIKIHGGPTQERTVDLLACYRGVFIAIEAKDGFKHDPTALQQETLDAVARAGGEAVCAHDLQEALDVLDKIDGRGTW